MTENPSQPTAREIERWRRYLAEERIEAQTYRNLAKRETGAQQQIMLRLAEAEKRHEQHWERLLGPHADPPPKPRFSSRVFSALAGRFGSVFTLALVQRSELRDVYRAERDATQTMAADERIHGEVVRSLAAASRSRIAGNFRAIIFGVNDGLISNLALILGVAGAGMGSGWVVTTGIAGLLAGSLSMAAGEWISVSSARELLDASTPEPLPALGLAHLNVDENELALLFQARGESESEAARHAAEVFAGVTGRSAAEPDPVERATQTVGTEESSGEQIGSPLQVAFSSFLSFALGAAVPLIPFLLGMGGLPAVLVAAATVGVVLLFTGGIVGLLSGRRAWASALRQLAIGASAAAITFGLGTLFGN